MFMERVINYKLAQIFDYTFSFSSIKFCFALLKNVIFRYYIIKIIHIFIKNKKIK